MAEHEDFATLFGQFEREQTGSRKRDPQVGDRVRGKIVSIGSQYVLVDIGAKSEGILEVEGLTDADGHLTVRIGDTIEALITGKDEETGTLRLGSQHGRRVHSSEELEQAFRHQLPVAGRVSKVVQGGVEVQISGVRAFCPASQLDQHYIADLTTFVGQKYDFRIIRYERGRHANVILSRRALLEEEQQLRAQETRTRLEVGAVLSGTVTALKEYGAFVDLGGLEGMVHISELAYGHVQHPQEVLSIDQRVEVAVLRIEKTDDPKHPEKIALSIRALAPDPWRNAERQFPVGTQCQGTVTRLQPFGAFVELAPGVEGLIHVGELGAGRRVSHPREVVKPGEEVMATVLSVDVARRRIGLSLEAEGTSASAAEVKDYTESTRQPEGYGTLGERLREAMIKKK